MAQANSTVTRDPEEIFRWSDYKAHQNTIYAGVGGPMWLRTYQEFQRYWCGRLEKPILNAACGPDAAMLSDFDVVNMDIEDPATREPIEDTPEKFELGDLFHMRYADGQFKTVVLGETLEHCTFDAAVTVLRECKRVLADDGRLILTFPLDPRSREEQNYFSKISEYQDEHVYSAGITARHQTYWDMVSLIRLWEEVGLEDAEPRVVLVYFFTSPLAGFGCVMKKKQ